MGSTRLPGKALVSLAGEPLLLRLLRRMRLSREAATVVIATTKLASDDVVAEKAHAWGIPVFRGSQEDLTSRLLGTARAYGLTAIVRVTGDNPLTDPAGIDRLIQTFRNGQYDIVHNTDRTGYPYGTGAELMSVATLERCNRELVEKWDREYVFWLVRTSPRFASLQLTSPEHLCRPNVYLTVDYSADLELLNRVYSHFCGRDDITLEQIVGFLDQNPALCEINRRLHENTTVRPLRSAPGS